MSPWSFRAADRGFSTLNTDRAVLTLSSPEALTQAALAGAGIAEVGVHHAWRHLVAGSMKALLLQQHHPGSFEMTLQYPHRALVAPRVRSTVEYLLAGFAGLAELHVPHEALMQYAAS